MRTAPFVLGMLVTSVSVGFAQEKPIIIENAHVKYTISAEGKNLAFIDRSTGLDYLKRDSQSVCALVRCNKTEYPATSVSLADDRLTIEFRKANAKAVLHVESRQSYIRLAVESVSGDNVESLVFLNIPLTLGGRPNEPFGSCALSLNVTTRVNQLPALQTSLQASCYAKFGMEGAIDFEAKRLFVTAKKSTGEILEWQPKNRKNREVPLSDETMSLLAKMQGDAAEGHPYVFIPPQRLERILWRRSRGLWHSRSEPINNMARNFTRIRTVAGVVKCTLHDLRRSAITNWAQGLPIQDVQTLAGHSSITTTRKYYLAVRPEYLDRASQVQNSVLSGRAAN